MAGPSSIHRTGRPQISDALHNQVIDLKEEGLTPKEVIERTGLSQTKVYEIFRFPVRKAAKGKAPGPTSEG